jgi:opacity protein-like surface antigen
MAVKSLSVFTFIFCLVASNVLAGEGAYYSFSGAQQFENGSVLQEEGNIPRPQPLFNTGGIIGYQKGQLRFEGEFTYRDNESSGMIHHPSSLLKNDILGPHRYLGNVFYDFKSPVAALKPYAGVGLGRATVERKGRDATFLTTMLKKEDTGIAYTGVIGLSYRVTSLLDFSLEYNYFGLEDLDIDDEDGRPTETRYESHNFNLGLRFQF